MSDVVPHKMAVGRPGQLRSYRSIPEKIVFELGSCPQIQFSEHDFGRATCLGCHDAPCMDLSASELNLSGNLTAFPGDPSLEVCPTDAIDWDDAAAAPRVDAELCIGCGICAVRCPYGAISLSSEGVAVVQHCDPDHIATDGTSPIESHTTALRVGSLGHLASPFIGDLPQQLAKLTDLQSTRLARNLLLACGIAARMRRRGDTNIRMDGLLRFRSHQIGVIELEVGAASLELPRALLEDIAVLHSRYQVPIETIVPISLVASLPSARSEYYHVVDDIAKVLEIQCHTLTFGVLAMLMWNFQQLDKLDENLFATTTGSTNLHSSLVCLLPELPQAEPYLGAYLPPK